MVKCASESLGMPASRSRKTRAGIWRRYLPTAAGSLMYDRGKDTADRQDGAVCARLGRSSFVARFDGCIVTHHGRCPYPNGRAKHHAPPPHPDSQPF